MAHRRRSRRFRAWTFAGCAVLALAALALAGCVGTPPTPTIAGYDLDYPAPGFGGKTRLNRSLLVEVVAGSQSLAGSDMLYQTAPYRRDSYRYARWVSPPADLLSEWIVRDLSRSGLVTAAFAATSGLDFRFVLQGTVRQFLEVDQGKSGVARVSVTAGLLDTRTPDGGQSVLYQKEYEAEAPMPSQTAEGLAAGMSAAVAELSKSVILDAYQALATYPR